MYSLDKPLSSPFDPLGEEDGKLFSVAPFCLLMDYFPYSRIFQICS